MQLIDFEKARKEVLAVLAGKVNTVIAIKVVEALKKATIEAEPVVHAKWVDRYGGKYVNYLYECSECKEKALYKVSVSTLFNEFIVQELSDYCPICGAKMDGDSHE